MNTCRPFLLLVAVALLTTAGFGADRPVRPADVALPVAAKVLPPAVAIAKPAIEVAVIENPFRPIDDRSVYSPSSNRPSPFFYVMESSSGAEPVFIGRRIGLGEMLAEFIRPSAMGNLPGGREVFINNRFYARKDVLRLEVTKNPNSYEIPIAELVIEEVGEDYVDIVYRPTQSSNRVTFNLTPDITGEGPKNRTEGASLWFLGAEDAELKAGGATDAPRAKSLQPARPRTPKAKPAATKPSVPKPPVVQPVAPVAAAPVKDVPPAKKPVPAQVSVAAKR